MAEPLRIPSDAWVVGALRFGSLATEIPRADLVQDELAVYPVPWTAWRVHDALATNLPGTAAADDLALVGGTFGSASPSLQTGDLKAAGATTMYARAQLWLPPEYDAGETVILRARAGMLTTAADTTATLDVEAYKSDSEAGVGADLCATAAQSINSTSLADYDFTITPTTLAAGDVLDVRLAVAVNDGATGTAVIGFLGALSLLLDVRG